MTALGHLLRKRLYGDERWSRYLRARVAREAARDERRAERDDPWRYHREARAAMLADQARRAAAESPRQRRRRELGIVGRWDRGVLLTSEREARLRAEGLRRLEPPDRGNPSRATRA
jgi:hypothetical protein